MFDFLTLLYKQALHLYASEFGNTNQMKKLKKEKKYTFITHTVVAAIFLAQVKYSI